MRKWNSGDQKRNRKPIFRFLLVCILVSIFFAPYISAAEKWTGVDEAVVEKIAKEHGREKREPLINTDQGDLLLFVFLIAGSVGGFVAGYYWRIIIVERTPEVNKKSTQSKDDMGVT